MKSLPEIVRQKDLKATFEIILTDLEQAHLKHSPEGELADQILSKIKTARCSVEGEIEINQNNFSYVGYLGILEKEVNELISLLFRKTSCGICFNYENEENRQSLVNFVKGLEQEGNRAEKNERKEVK